MLTWTLEGTHTENSSAMAEVYVSMTESDASSWPEGPTGSVIGTNQDTISREAWDHAPATAGLYGS